MTKISMYKDGGIKLVDNAETKTLLLAAGWKTEAPKEEAKEVSKKEAK